MEQETKFDRLPGIVPNDVIIFFDKFVCDNYLMGGRQQG